MRILAAALAAFGLVAVAGRWLTETPAAAQGTVLTVRPAPGSRPVPPARG
jgi:hypothetical protein